MKVQMSLWHDSWICMSGRNSEGMISDWIWIIFLYVYNSFVVCILRYMDKEGQLFSQFLDLVNVSDGKADTIVAAIKDVLHKKKIPTQRLYGLGTDGAAVMTGMNSQHNKVEYSLGFLTWISYCMYVLILFYSWNREVEWCNKAAPGWLPLVAASCMCCTSPRLGMQGCLISCHLYGHLQRPFAAAPSLFPQ